MIIIKYVIFSLNIKIVSIIFWTFFGHFSFKIKVINEE